MLGLNSPNLLKAIERKTKIYSFTYGVSYSVTFVTIFDSVIVLASEATCTFLKNKNLGLFCCPVFFLYFCL